MRSQFRFIRCTIERGGFASERCFTITNATGDKVVGVADVAYLYTADYAQVPEGEPPSGSKIDGFVKCRVLRRGTDEATVIVDLPSNDVATVEATALLEEGAPMTCGAL